MTDNYYHILGLDNFASEEKIKKAYRQLAKKYHPDRNPGQPHFEDKFKRVSKAYQVLSDPEKKLQFDARLVYQKKTVASPIPRYTRRRSRYTTEKKQYTPAAWMYGKIFIIIFIMIVILIPLVLLHHSSVRAYERGLEEYEQGSMYKALASFNRAIKRFGGRSVSAAIKGGEISIYDLNDYEQGLYFANLGLKYAELPNDLAHLYYLRGLAHKGMEHFETALQEFLRADSLQFNKDSLQLQLGLLRAFGLLQYKQAEKSFDYLIKNRITPEVAWFGKAWCQQNQGMNEQAIDGYTQVILLNPEHPMAYYYRGMNEIILSDSTSACNDFEKAMILGYPKAPDMFSYHCTEKEDQVEE